MSKRASPGLLRTAGLTHDRDGLSGWELLHRPNAVIMTQGSQQTRTGPLLLPGRLRCHPFLRVVPLASAPILPGHVCRHVTRRRRLATAAGARDSRYSSAWRFSGWGSASWAESVHWVGGVGKSASAGCRSGHFVSVAYQHPERHDSQRSSCLPRRRRDGAPGPALASRGLRLGEQHTSRTGTHRSRPAARQLLRGEQHEPI